MTQVDAIFKLADDFEEAVNTLRSGDVPPLTEPTAKIPVEERTWKTYPANQTYMVQGLARMSHSTLALSRKLTGISEDDFYGASEEIRDQLKKLAMDLLIVRNVFAAMVGQ